MTAAYTVHLYPRKILREGGKYGNTSARYKGNVYHSRLEAAYAAELDSRKRAHNASERVVRWERQVKIPLIVAGQLIANYYADFEVTFGDGRVELHEVKGYETEVWRLKRKLVDALFPNRLKVIR
jgi:hypothetical protein